jgi:predicted RNA methylase
LEETLNHIVEKKHLGQYFSGPAISSLLANLANSDGAETIIDPMCGTGDMLAACNPTKHPNKIYVGVEIDSAVLGYSSKKFKKNKNVKLIKGNAFKLNTIKKIASTEFDLVITNPPYVRYQTLSGNQADSPDFLSPSEIKSNLISSLQLFKQLDKEDQRLFEYLISNYSGLSDLAVPSWILCALLTKVNGCIAMVVPQTWLNREYASVVRYILLRWFQIEYIIEDGHSTWFSNAQVKTTLIVAKRVKRKDSIFSWNGQQLTYCTIYSDANNSYSLVGRVFPDQERPEECFLKSINTHQYRNNFLYSRKIRVADFANDLKPLFTNNKWLNFVEPTISQNPKSDLLLKAASELWEWMQDLKPQFQVLSDIGVSVSQGLRTGANVFFYLDIVEYFNDGVLVLPNKTFLQKPIFIPKQFYREVVRKQSELNESYCLNDFKPTGIVLALQNAVCTKDIFSNKKLIKALRKAYKPVPADLEKFIQKAETTNIGSQSVPKYIPNLSAVQPNIKSWNPDKQEDLPRFWYMLPSFTKRHSPDLFVPRVNSLHPVTRLNSKGEYLIDANFSALWISDPKSNYNSYSLLALLNSSWCISAMEEYGTVMGGGALKLEAAQLNKIPIPILKQDAISELSVLGKQLTQKASKPITVLDKIDKVILKAFGIEKNTSERLKELTSLKAHLLKQRSRK